jgi:hypothetical protein
MCKVGEQLTLQVLEGFHKECMQESSLRLRVVRKLKRDKAFEAIEGSTRSGCISSESKASKFCFIGG